MTAICLDKDVVRLAVFLVSYDPSTIYELIDYFVNDRRPSDFRNKRNIVRGYVTRFRSYCRNDRFIVKVLTLVRDLLVRDLVKPVISYNGDGSVFCSLCGTVVYSRVDQKGFRLAAAEHLWVIHRNYVLDTVEYVYNLIR
jgi:hypothetical protein